MYAADAVALGILRTLCVSIGGATGRANAQELTVRPSCIRPQGVYAVKFNFMPVSQLDMDDHIS